MEKDQGPVLLLKAKEEITALRRLNDILAAKVETMELFATVLHTKPAFRSSAASEDICWEINNYLRDLDAVKEPG